VAVRKDESVTIVPNYIAIVFPYLKRTNGLRLIFYTVITRPLIARRVMIGTLRNFAAFAKRQV
jgi:hypothetical protein